MKEILRSVTSFTLKAVILLFLIGVFSGLSYLLLIRPAVKNLIQQQSMSVDGTAKKYIKPDLAVVSVGAIMNNTSAANLKKDADTALTKTRTEIIASGITEEKIKSNYTISPKYDKDYQNIVGYTTRVTMEVKTNDFTKVDTVLESAQKNGLILVDGVSFVIEDPIKAKEELRTAAIAAAKAKAEKLANETGISLGKVINISEGYQPYYTNSYLKTNTYLAASVVEDTSSSASTFDAGETEVQMTVTLTYETN